MRLPPILVTGALALSLGACATTAEPEVKTVTVNVPVRTPCVPADLPPPPERYADEGLDAATPPDQRYLKTAEANLQRRARLARVEPVIANCR